ncbi:MAG: type II toxin-antitoxin system prevent-host-death family antitoxin [Propionibacteriaceae bacterium]|nr:type II toxin-antitoxin system prevent-host-death family antitoxin [Propionibacteriaceae bacterium]
MSAQPVEHIEVGAYEAKTHLAQLLDQVEAGNVISITRHGKKTAILSPAIDATVAADQRRRQAIADLLELTHKYEGPNDLDHRAWTRDDLYER